MLDNLGLSNQHFIGQLEAEQKTTKEHFEINKFYSIETDMVWKTPLLWVCWNKKKSNNALFFAHFLHM